MLILQQLIDKWVTLTSSYCTPDEIPAIGLMPETTEKRSVVTEEVTENGHVTAKLEAYTVTSATNSATPFCMTFGSGQSSVTPSDVILAHVYIHQGLTAKDVHDDVKAAINKWIGTLDCDPKPKYDNFSNYSFLLSQQIAGFCHRVFN